MSIQIRKDRCVGCGKCQEVCPGTLIQIDRQKSSHEIPEKLLGLRFLRKRMQSRCH